MGLVLACSRFSFPKYVEEFGGPNSKDSAYISISATKECAEHYLQYNLSKDWESECSHYLLDSDNVCNVNFDDLEKDIIFTDNIVFRTISEEQAKKIVLFIEKNLGKNFLIHCRAGMSRSQGVVRFILDTYPDYREHPDNHCITPNREVVRKLKNEYYKIKKERD